MSKQQATKPLEYHDKKTGQTFIYVAGYMWDDVSTGGFENRLVEDFNAALKAIGSEWKMKDDGGEEGMSLILYKGPKPPSLRSVRKAEEEFFDKQL